MLFGKVFASLVAEILNSWCQVFQNQLCMWEFDASGRSKSRFGRPDTNFIG